jgi:hypothetical protein
VARLIGSGAFLGQLKRVLVQHRARAAGVRITGVGARAELVPEPREDPFELVRHEQLSRPDVMLRRQLVQLAETPAAG